MVHHLNHHTGPNQLCWLGLICRYQRGGNRCSLSNWRITGKQGLIADKPTWVVLDDEAYVTFMQPIAVVWDDADRQCPFFSFWLVPRRFTSVFICECLCQRVSWSELLWVCVWSVCLYISLCERVTDAVRHRGPKNEKSEGNLGYLGWFFPSTVYKQVTLKILTRTHMSFNFNSHFRL